MDYNFISIEGNIGVGKTSLATRIADQYNAKLILEQFEDNPFLPKFYKDHDKYAFPLELSFLASRYQQLKDELPSQDLFRTFTISDYFINKSLIFASRTIKEDELILYTRLFDIINTNLPKPDLLVYLYVDIERLISNIKFRGRSYEQEIKSSYLESIQESYFEYLRQQQDMRILIIDINNMDFVNSEANYKRLVKAIFQPYDFGINRVIL
ncbi:MAG: deoxynucleoside kinase [Bacteroidales bacterium]|nr:deoxynucleoside kinase [Bacteroidales bacterium]